MTNGVARSFTVNNSARQGSSTTGTRRWQTALSSYAWGSAVPALCTLLTWPLRKHLGSSSLLLIYLLGVLLVATRHGRCASFLASVLSAGAFAYFFAPPIFSLAVADTENVVALAAMLIVAHVTSSLMKKLRLQADIAARRERRAAVLHRLSGALSAARREHDVLETATRQIHEEFGVPSVLLLSHGDERSEVDPAPAPAVPRFETGDPAAASVGNDKTAPARSPGSDTFHQPLESSGVRIGKLALPGSFAANLADPEFRNFFEMFCAQLTQALERIRLTEQARLASVQVETESLRNSLLSVISHDLRTPLTRIMGAAGILAEREDTLDAEQRRELNKIIQDEAEQMSNLMSKILDMAHIAAGPIYLRREWNAVEEVVGGTLTRLEKSLEDRPVSIALAENLPLAWMDGVLLQQVLTNLIENAIKYSAPHSPIDITADTCGTQLQISIADRGPGFPEGHEEKLFEKFYRVEPESSRTGVGLGLALCRTIVEAHGGKMAAANRPGGGAIFTLTLPLREPPVVEREEEFCP